MKLKLISLLMVTTFVLIISGTTQAGTFSYSGWNLPVRYHLTNYDQGVVWVNPDGSNPDPGFYQDPRVAGDSPAWVDPISGLPDPFNDPVLMPVGMDGAMTPNEDTWGIVRLDQISEAFVDEMHFNLEPTGDPALWNLGDPDPAGTPMEVWGIFYGNTDKWVQVELDGGQQIMGDGLKFKIWAQPLGSFSDVHGPLGNKQFGSADRLAADIYAGIGYDEFGVPIPGASLWLSGEMVDGFLIEPDTGVRAHTIATQFEGIGNLDGEAQMWSEYWGGPDAQPGDGPVGSANQAWDYNWYWADFGTNPDYVADMRLQIDNKAVTDQNAIWDWEVTSSDPGQMYGVPEPMTMLGVFLGVSSLTGYIRRRKLV
jgi:hypothetical protein